MAPAAGTSAGHPPPHHARSSTSSSSRKPLLLTPSLHSGSVADDERSDHDSPSAMKKPAYPGEDTRPTSSRELWGWYAYGWAAEPFVVSGVASFIPITLEQLARDSPSSALLADKSKPCHALAGAPGGSAPAAQQCVVRLLGLELNTASFAMYTFSASVLVQALVIISMSGAADHGRHRKALLLGFALAGAVATMLFLPVGPQLVVLAAVLAIVANTCFGASFVLLNSFLPLLVRRAQAVEAVVENALDEPLVADNAPAPQPLGMHDEDDIDDDNDDPALLASSTSALLPGPTDGAGPDTPTSSLTKPNAQAEAAALQLSTRISANGIGIGYIAAFIVQSTAMVVVQAMGGTQLSLRTALFVVGAWWLLFSLPTALWLRPRPGPPLKLDDDDDGGTHPKRHLWLRYLTHSWKGLGRTLLRARRLRDLMTFLAAWFLLSDAIATISGTSVLFAKTTLQMTPVALAMINIMTMVAGVLGAFLWRAASRRLGLSPLGTILACLALFAAIPLYALLGFVPRCPLGLKQPWEMYPLGFLYGIVLGGLSAYCRALFGSLIPPGSEAAFYALYAVTDKGSSVVGPAVVGAITDRFGEIRPAFVFLTVLIIAPGLVLVWVDVERGTQAAKDAAQAVSGADLGESYTRDD